MEDYIIHEKSRQNWLVAIVAVTVFMFSVDYSMLNISLPEMAEHFKATITHVSRLPLAYLLVVTSTALLFGKLGDILGFKKVFIAGLVVFMTGTLMCGFAPNLNTLLALRIYQCIGEAMFGPMGIALITFFLPPGIKGKALGVMATAQGLGFCVGSPLGGYINSHFGWHGIFFVNVPIALAAIMASIKLVPSKQPVLPDKRLDIIGAVSIFICLSTLIYGLNSIAAMGFKSPVVVSCFAVSAAAFILFLTQEARTRNPILHLPLFRDRDFAFATASAFCVIFVYIGLIFILPFYFDMVRKIDVAEFGLLLMLPALMVVISAPISGYVSDKIGSRPVCVFGICLTTLAFFMFSFFRPDSPIYFIAPSLVIAGVAIGCFLPANNKLVMALAPQDKQGMASAIYKILNSIGGVFGIAILPLVLIKRFRFEAALAHLDVETAKHMPQILVTGFDAAFKFAMFVCIAGLFFTIMARDRQSAR